ncbi:hypothetical protein Vadar_027429 [Vaccinium darrowii]|uniref:Uncharacterized protein n=1 Tax=Vaccinium darrowii TaxID=229202 RepID=A0ACB7ZFP0_9ERIC|nr:hypothetical protein Vadar_027429 [Vaccinium darrowii]
MILRLVLSALTARSCGHTPQFPVAQATEERYKNKGDYIVLVPPHFDSPVFHSFEAVTPRPEANPYYDYEDVIDSDEELDFESMG